MNQMPVWRRSTSLGFLEAKLHYKIEHCVDRIASGVGRLMAKPMPEMELMVTCDRHSGRRGVPRFMLTFDIANVILLRPILWQIK